MDNKEKNALKQLLTDTQSNLTDFKSEKVQQEETTKTQHLYKLMGSLFGGKWESQNGEIGGSKFYDWADVIEPMCPKIIRHKFNELEKIFKTDVAKGKDIWPPTIAFFLALASQVRINEAMYRDFKYELPEHTKAEYQEFAKAGWAKINKILGN